MVYHASMVITIAEQRMTEDRQRAERIGRVRRARAAARRPEGKRHGAYRRVLATAQPQA